MIISNSLQWFISIEILAIISFILTFKFFNNLNDKGYCISKATGIGLTGFISWIIMLFSNGNYSFSPTISYTGIGLLSIISLVLTFKLLDNNERKDLFQFIDQKYKFILFIEIVFLVILIGGTYIKGFSPDILGVHKLQEYIYIKSILISDTLPPANIWLSGHTLNIYYFGYFIFANLINISSINIDLAFNLIPATLLGIIVIASGGIIYNLTNSKALGLLGGFITGFMSNHEALFQILEKGTINGFNWWLSAHTFTNGIFTEFPYWSFLLGDIPSYFISSIFILAIIYFIYTAIKNNYTINLSKLICTENIFIIITSILFAITGLTNITSMLFALFLMLLAYSYNHKNKDTANTRPKYPILTVLSIILFTSIILIPFYINHSPASLSITVNKIFDHSQTKAFISTFGYFFIPIIVFIVLKLKETLKINNINLLFIFIILCSALEAYLLLKQGLSSSFIMIILSVLLLSIGIYFIYRTFQTQTETNKYTIKAISISACLLLALTILIYLYPIVTLFSILIVFSIFMLLTNKDKTIYIIFCLLLSTATIILLGLLINVTINKTGIQIINSQLLSNSLLILALSITPIMYYSFKSMPDNKKEFFSISISVLLLPCLLFTVMGTMEKTHNFKVIPNLVPMLSGTNHLIHFHGNENSSIDWLKSNAIKGSIILESCIPNEIYSGRISSYSGLSNIINWPNKQRIAYSKSMENEITNRVNDVNTIYSEPKKSKIINLIKKYNIKYIYVGELENKTYPIESLKDFESIGKIVYTSSDTSEKGSIIYEID